MKVETYYSIGDRVIINLDPEQRENEITAILVTENNNVQYEVFDGVEKAVVYGFQLREVE